ncbi:MAG: hydantoinase/oxoprolinase family protein [Proteobacteria bacterium]|nr:hydantoinase/oxoprolinase family protein [Pseudomonadota bacterium]
MSKVRVAVDIGGTFTDICILDEATNTLRVQKVPSTRDPIDAALEGIAKAGVNLADITLFSHGTTVATNALIQRNLPHAAVVCTEGFRDVIEIGNSTKADLWDAYQDNPPPYIRRRDRLTIRERTSAAGVVERSIDEAEARELAAKLRKRGYRAVAICFMNAFANGENERALKAVLEAELPGVAVTTSSEVLPEIFEHERFSTTVVNAVLQPVVGDYARRLQDRLAAGGYDSDVLLLHSGGGVMTPKSTDRQAARLASSGIAAGAIANRYIGQLCGYPNVIGFDMGGTSTDVSLAWQGELLTTRDWYIEYGHPICFPSIDIKTIGAGGGSIAWIDEAGSLRNGPQSAGSDPGPACYGRGGEEPANTDANLVLGRLGAGLAGGDLGLDVARARAAIDMRVARPLGMNVEAAAQAILRVANANMADAVRLVSIMRGYDPRDFALVAFGGAGALHGAAIAADLAIPKVIVPPHPGVTSAMGCLLVDIRHDLLSTYLVDSAVADAADIEREFRVLEDEARERLAHEGVAEASMVLTRSIDMRYGGQWRSLTVPVLRPFTNVAAAVEDFGAAHQREYNYRRNGAVVEIFRLNLTAIGVTPKAEFARHAPGGAMPAPRSTRSVTFDEGIQETPIFWREDLPAGVAFAGPAVVEQFDATTLVPPGARAEVDAWLNIVITV